MSAAAANEIARCAKSTVAYWSGTSRPLVRHLQVSMEKGREHKTERKSQTNVHHGLRGGATHECSCLSCCVRSSISTHSSSSSSSARYVTGIKFCCSGATSARSRPRKKFGEPSTENDTCDFRETRNLRRWHSTLLLF